MGGGSSGFNNEFKDAHYRQSLTGSKLNQGRSSYGPGYSEIYDAKKHH